MKAGGQVPQGPQTPARPSQCLNNLGGYSPPAGTPSSATAPEAVSMATRACELTRNREASGTIAAACAEAGPIDQAVSPAPRAPDAAVAHGDTNAAVRDLELVRIYRDREPFLRPRPPALTFGVLAPPFHAIPRWFASFRASLTAESASGPAGGPFSQEGAINMAPAI